MFLPDIVRSLGHNILRAGAPVAIADTILHRIRGHGRGFVFTARDFLDLGSRAAVDQALARLVAAATIRRIDRGVYDLPRLHPRVGPLWPSADAVARAIARQTNSHIKGSGPVAVNALGLTTQVPANPVFLTDGPSRRVHLGNLLVVLRHAGRVEMLLPDSMAGLVIVALRYLGRDAVSAPELLDRLARRLDDTDKTRLRNVRKQLPGWLGLVVDRLSGMAIDDGGEAVVACPNTLPRTDR